MKPGHVLAKFYGIHVGSAYAHNDGNWFWNLEKFPGAYFDGEGVVVFQTEGDYRRCLHLSIGPRNTWVRNKAAGMSIADIPGYSRLDPPPRSL